MYYEQQKAAELEKKVIPQTKKADFEEFWKTQVEALRKIPLQYTREKLDLPYEKTFLSYKITYNTHDDTMVDAYFSCPVNSEGKKLPCVVRYHGGSGHKEIYADIVATGVCCLAIDVRSQGGTTVDKAVYHSGDRNGGLMTCGVLDKNEFYMRNIVKTAKYAIFAVALALVASCNDSDDISEIFIGHAVGARVVLCPLLRLRLAAKAKNAMLS